MPKYKYSAVTIDGKEVKNQTINATNEVTALTLLRADGYYPSAIQEVREGSLEITTAKVKPRAMAGFCNQMAAMARAGVPISTTLEILRDQAEDPVLKKIMPDVYVDVHKGSSLSEALAPHAKRLPSFFLSMVEAGEASGSLDRCMERAAQSFTTSSKLNQKVKGAMIYPLVLLIVLIGVIVLMMTMVVPQFAAIYADLDAELPAMTLMLMAVSEFFVTRWFILLGAAIAVVGGFIFWKQSKTGAMAFDSFILKIPKVGKLLQKIYAARFAESLSSLTVAGVSLPDAIDITARSVSNKYIEWGLGEAVEALRKGETLSSQLSKMGVFPPLIVYVVRTGEESGTMEELLAKTSEFYNDEAEAAVTALISLLQPLLIVVMAIVILPVLLGIVQPMFGMYMEML